MKMFLLTLVALLSLQARADRVQDIYQHIKDKKWFSDVTYNRLKKDGLFRFLVADGLCPVKPEELKDAPAEQLFAKGQEFMDRKRYCKAASYYYKIVMQYPVMPHYKKAWISLIKAYVAAEDYVLAINESNDFMDLMVGTPEMEEVHYLVMRSVYLKLKEADVDTYQLWTYYALGVSSDQNNNNPYYKNLMFSSFIEKYPDSVHIPEINQWKLDARDQLNTYHLRIGQEHYKQRKYLAALMRYQFVLKYGITVAPFAETMFECVRANFDFAKQILDPEELSDLRLNELMRLPGEATVDREKVSKATLAQAYSFLEKMETNLPGNPWTLKAREFIENDGKLKKKK